METNAAILCKSYVPDGPPAPSLFSGTITAPKKDLFQKLHDQGFLDILLRDRTTRKSIIWATDTYSDLGKGFGKTDRITPELILGRHELLSSIRKERRIDRTRKHGEVSTPLPVCKRMCDYAYRTLRGKDWRKYVNSTLLEITCGEAPFLASRRDLGTGAEVPVKDRVGILDRKLLVIGEKTGSRDEWLEWAYKAYEATYGYEFQGYNLLMARINLLETFREHMKHRFGARPCEQEIKRILEIISWNIWQMDGLTGTLPYGTLKRTRQCSFFDAVDADNKTPACLIKDWKTGKIVTWLSCGGGK